MPGTVVAVVGVDTLQNAEFKLPEEERKQILDGVEKDFKGTTFAGLLPEKADAELKKWLQAKAEGQDPKMALALMRDLFDLDTVMAFKEAKVPVRCINSAGGYQLFTPTAVETNKKYADFGAVIIEGAGIPRVPNPSPPVPLDTGNSLKIFASPFFAKLGVTRPRRRMAAPVSSSMARISGGMRTACSPASNAKVRTQAWAQPSLKRSFAMRSSEGRGVAIRGIHLFPPGTQFYPTYRR